MTREEQVRIVRDSVSTSDVDNPITFDPPEWALRAVERAFALGHHDGRFRQRQIDHDSRVPENVAGTGSSEASLRNGGR